MKNLFTIAVLGGAMALTACGNDKDGDSGDTGATTGGTTAPTTAPTTPADDMIVAVQADCPDDDTFQITVETNFAVGDATVNIWEVLAGAAGYDEEHAMVAMPVAGAAGDDVVWDLADEAATRGGFVSGTDTLFQCNGDLSHNTSDAMVYVARVYDADGVYEDCGAWGGDRIADVLAEPAGGGDVTSYNPVSNAAEITADNCIVF